MKKKLLVFCALLCCISVFFSACTSQCLFKNDKYSITQKNEKFYINFRDRFVTNPYPPMGLISVPNMTFSSVKEMQQTILNGGISDEKLAEMQYYAETTAGPDRRLEIVDITTVYEPLLPGEFTVYEVEFWLTEYFLDFTGTFDGACAVKTKSYWETDQMRYTTMSDFSQILSDEIIEDRNARRIHYKSSTGEFVTLQYDIVLENMTLTVYEQYCLDYYMDIDWARGKISDTVPYDVHVFGVFGADDQTYFRYYFDNAPTERPSVAWLSSLGIVECK